MTAKTTSANFGAVRLSPVEGVSAGDLVSQAKMIAAEASDMASDMAALLEEERDVSPMTAHGIARLLELSNGILGAAEAACRAAGSSENASD